jgi:hypothetical protein
MSFITWLALPVVITMIASLIMLLLTRWPRTDTHQDIESFARFRVALARQMAAPSPPQAEPPETAPVRAGTGTVVEDRPSPAHSGLAASPDR